MFRARHEHHGRRTARGIDKGTDVHAVGIREDVVVVHDMYLIQIKTPAQSTGR